MPQKPDARDSRAFSYLHEMTGGLERIGANLVCSNLQYEKITL